MQMENFEREIHQMKDQMSTLNGKVDKILLAISGNDLDKNDAGMLGDVRQLKVRVARLERWKDRAVYWLIGASFGAGSTISYLIQQWLKAK